MCPQDSPDPSQEEARLVSLAEKVPRYPEGLSVIRGPIIEIQPGKSGWGPSHILKSSSYIPAPNLCKAGPKGSSHIQIAKWILKGGR